MESLDGRHRYHTYDVTEAIREFSVETTLWGAAANAGLVRETSPTSPGSLSSTLTSTPSFRQVRR